MSSQVIKASNNLTEISPKTYLNTAYSSAGTSITVKNINGFPISYAIQIGDTGKERSEVKIISGTPAGGTINLTSGLSYDHPADTPIYAIKYDKVIFSRSTSGTSGTATPMINGTVDITPDSLYTQFTDENGDSSYGYRAEWYNSVLLTKSNVSDWITTDGYSFYSLSSIRSRAKNRLFDSDYIKNDSIIDDWINEWLEYMTNTAIDVNKDYSLGTVDVAHGTDGLATITSSDFKEVRRVWYTTNGSDFYSAAKIDITGFEPDETFSEASPFFYYFGDSVIGKKPDGTSGTARITYYKTSERLTDDTDELPVSMRNYTTSFVNYVTGQAYFMDGKTNEGERFLGLAELDKEKFKTQITPRSKQGPTFIDMVSDVDGEDFFSFPYI